jgi:hypothetical protein
VTLKLTACVTSSPFENTVSRSVPTVWKSNGNGHGPAGIVPVRSSSISVTAGLSAEAAGANANSAVAAAASAKAFAFMSFLLVSCLRLYDPDAMRQSLRRFRL